MTGAEQEDFGLCRTCWADIEAGNKFSSERDFCPPSDGYLHFRPDAER